MTSVSPAPMPPAPSPAPQEKNTPATVSLVFGIISIFVNPFLIATLVGLITGIIGAVRGPFGRTRAIIGMVLSVVGAIVGIIVMVLIFGAIGAASDAIASAAPKDATPVAAAPSDDDSPAPGSNDAGSSSETTKFGQSVKYDDGLSITVKDLGKYKPSEYAAVDDSFKHFEKFEVIIKNNTSKAFDPTLASATVSSADNEGDQVFDTENGYSLAPQTKVLPGRSIHYKVAFGITDPKDITFDFTPNGFDYNDAIFTK